MHLFAVDDDAWRSGDTAADLVSAEADHRDDDIATDAQRFVGTAAEDEHAFTPCQTRWFHSSGTQDGVIWANYQAVAVFDDANRRRAGATNREAECYDNLRIRVASGGHASADRNSRIFAAPGLA
jgi:hypothetical protein